MIRFRKFHNSRRLEGRSEGRYTSIAEAGSFTIIGTHHPNRAADRLVIGAVVCTIMEVLTKRCRSLLTYWNETPRRAATFSIAKGKSVSFFATANRAKFFNI